MNKKKGADGEAWAVQYLQSIGYSILARNIRTPYGEIDIIAKEGDELIFVEVKVRSTESFGHILEQISTKKRTCFTHSAEHLLAKEQQECTARFDYIGLRYNKGKYQVYHIKNIIDI